MATALKEFTVSWKKRSSEPEVAKPLLGLELKLCQDVLIAPKGGIYIGADNP